MVIAESKYLEIIINSLQENVKIYCMDTNKDYYYYYYYPHFLPNFSRVKYV